MSDPVAASMSVTIGGVATEAEAFTVDYQRNAPASGSLTLGYPLPAQVTDLASCRVQFTIGASTFDAFNGSVLVPSRKFDDQGPTITLPIRGNLLRTEFAMNADKAFAGGAKADPVTLSLGGDTSVHMGTQTVAWYADPSPDGAPDLDFTFTPTADSTFIWIAGRAHGTNSYDTDTGDKTIKDHSKILIRQGGVELGRAFFPVLSEDWSSMNDYTDDANWSDFDLFVACDPAISASGGSVTVRVHSGHKPGSSDYDEFEVKAITWQIAGTTTVRNIARGVLKFCGLASGEYQCWEITDLSGNVVYLGGNGKVDAGQVRISATDRPLDFLSRVLGLFGFAVFDCPDGVVRIRPFRGVPHATPVATFAEGVDTFSEANNGDAGNVYNSVTVAGASGTDANGKRFAYGATTASPVPHPLIPERNGETGVRDYPVNDQLLTSTALCTAVHDVQLDNHDDALTSIDWEAEPRVLELGDTVSVTAPIAGYTGSLWLVALGYDFDATNGPNMRCSGWTGGSATVTETDDPDPTEDDIEPGDPRPQSGPNKEWSRYSPNAGVN